MADEEDVEVGVERGRGLQKDLLLKRRADDARGAQVRHVHIRRQAGGDAPLVVRPPAAVAARRQPGRLNRQGEGDPRAADRDDGGLRAEPEPVSGFL